MDKKEALRDIDVALKTIREMCHGTTAEAGALLRRYQESMENAREKLIRGDDDWLEALLPGKTAVSRVSRLK